MFHSLPYEPRVLEATEDRLTQIYDAARMGLKGDALALAIDMTPQEYRALKSRDAMAQYAEERGRASGELEMARILHTAATNGDTKAALEMLKYAHRWSAPQSVQIQVDQKISITAALEQAKMRVIEGTLADANILPGRRTEFDGDAMVASDQG
jgi:hypothetical protein